MTLKALVLTAACIGAVSISNAKTWTDTRGRTLEADFVKIENNVVALRKADGKVVRVPLNRLSSGDQQVARLMTSRASGGAKPATSPFSKTVTIKPLQKAVPNANAEAAVSVHCDAVMSKRVKRVNGEAAPKDVDILLTLTGQDAKNATHFSDITIEEALIGTTKARVSSRHLHFRKNMEPDMNRVTRGGHFDKHPDDGLGLSLTLSEVGNIESVTSLKGKLSLKTGGDKTEVVLSNFPQRKQAVNNSAFRAAGIKAETSYDGDNEIKIQFHSGGNIITSAVLVDAAGKQVETYGGWSASGDTREYEFSGKPQLPKNAQLKVTLVQNTRLVEVPFAFKDLTVK